MDQLIRLARETDFEFLSEMTLRSARSHQDRGVWDLLADDEDLILDILEELTLLEPPSSAHYSHFLVAEVNGEPAATLAGYDPAEVAPLGQAIALGFEALELDENRLLEAFERLERFNTCAPPQTRGIWIVEWVATHPDYLRRGLASRLLSEILERGKSSGHARAQISTFVENLPAIRAYEKTGFKVTREQHAEAFRDVVGSTGMVHMDLQL